MINGGIIGPFNNTSVSLASGIWSLNEQLIARGVGRWPLGLIAQSITFLQTPVSNFQIRIVLNNSNFTYALAKNDGGDLRFWTDFSFTTTIPYWIETWSPNGSSVVWIRVPNASMTSVVMTYGNQSLISQSNIDDVMDQALLVYYYGSGVVAQGAQAFQTLDFITQDVGSNIANYDWTSGNVTFGGQGARADYVSLRWRGWVKPTSTGTYTFWFRTDDGQRLYVAPNSSSLPIASPPSSWTLSSWIDQGPTEYFTNISINDLSPRFIWNEWFETGGGALSTLGWTPPNGSKSYPITVSQLRAPKHGTAFGDPFAYSATVSQP